MPWQELFGAQFNNDSSSPTFCTGLADWDPAYPVVRNSPSRSWLFRTADNKCVWNGAWCRKNGDTCKLWNYNYGRCDNRFTRSGEVSDYGNAAGAYYFPGNSGCVPSATYGYRRLVPQATLDAECQSLYGAADVCYDNTGAVVSCAGAYTWKFQKPLWRGGGSYSAIGYAPDSIGDIGGCFSQVDAASLGISFMQFWGCPTAFVEDNDPLVSLDLGDYYVPGGSMFGRWSGPTWVDAFSVTHCVNTTYTITNWATGARTFVCHSPCFEAVSGYGCPPDGHSTASGTGHDGYACDPDAADPVCGLPGYTFYASYAGLYPYFPSHPPACIKEYTERQGRMASSDIFENRYYQHLIDGWIRAGSIKENIVLGYLPQGVPVFSPYDWYYRYDRTGGTPGPTGVRIAGDIESGVVYEGDPLYRRYRTSHCVYDVKGGYAVIFFFKEPNEWRYAIIRETTPFNWEAKLHQHLCYGEVTMGRPQKLLSGVIRFFTYTTPDTATDADYDTVAHPSDLVVYESQHTNLDTGIISWKLPDILDSGAGDAPASSRRHGGDIFWDETVGAYIRTYLKIPSDDRQYDQWSAFSPRPPYPNYAGTWYISVRIKGTETDAFAWSIPVVFGPQTTGNFRRTPDGRLWYGNYVCKDFNLRGEGTWTFSP